MHCPCPNCGCGLNNRQFNSIDSEPPTTARARRIRALLTSNKPPLEHERISLSNVLSQNLLDLSNMDSQISRMRRALETLEACRATTATTISKLKVILSPIRTLPNDILCEIFNQCVEDASRWGCEQQLNQPPWTLSYICNRWRAVALSYPRMWSEIRVELPGQNEDKLAGVVSCQLLRSGSHLLSIRLRCGKHTPAKSPIIILLSTHSPRWKSLSFYSEVNSVNANIFDAVQGFLPSLRTLSLNGGALNHTAFRTAPNLMSVIGNTTALRCAPTHLAEYTSPLTIPVRDVIMALSNYRFLTKCTLSLMWPIGMNSSLTMPQLVNLSLKEGHLGSGTYLDYFMRSLTAPALKILEITGRINVDTLLACKRRSKFNLASLCLFNDQLTSDDCFCLVERLFSLQKLTLGCEKACTNTFFQRLERHSVLPLLQLLRIQRSLEERDSTALVMLMSLCQNITVEYQKNPSLRW